MKFTYSELLVMLAVLIVAVVITWTGVYYHTPSQLPVESRINAGSTDGPELRKATRMIMDSLKK